MAGYIFTLNSLHSLREIAQSGVYSTKLNIPDGTWKAHHEGTFADYLSMKAGDNVYFFHQRKIYGIGRLIDVAGSCVHLNFPGADRPDSNSFTTIQNEMILRESEENLENRFICTFAGNPFMFENGVDMDEVLASQPTAFRMLRAFWKLSFIKIDDIENKALFDYILKANEEFIDGSDGCFLINSTLHQRIETLHTQDYVATSNEIVSSVASGQRLRHEMAVEAAIIDYISHQTTNNIFGNWDYISHQVIASPFKPIDYMDKMDIFGYRYIPGYRTISKYLMTEIKKDAASIEVINQAMKYVDWIEQEYSHDYSMIEAFVVASDFSQEVIEERNLAARRFYTKGRTPAVTYEWANLRLIRYTYNEVIGTLEFEEI
ncbi:hypothetical protein [Solibacillus sp. FSL K6-1126]|uniref:hypothetical protein n=1 Tax=Solibacillus sp. FSL K6-1126 TaxID=2921463 RepID=UPI0030F9A1FC